MGYGQRMDWSIIMGASVYTNTAGQGYVFHGSALRPTGVIFANNNGLLYSAYGSGGGFIYSGNAKDNVFPYGTRIETRPKIDYYHAYDFDTISQLSSYASGAALGGYSLGPKYKMYSASGYLTSDIYATPHQYPLVFSARTEYSNIQRSPSASNLIIRPGVASDFSSNTESSFGWEIWNIVHTSDILQTAFKYQPPFYWFNSAMYPISSMKFTITVSGHFDQVGPGATGYGSVSLFDVKSASGHSGNNTVSYRASAYDTNDFTAQTTCSYDFYHPWCQSGEYPKLSRMGVALQKVAVDITGYIA
jgi:hypothetical protein